MLWWWCGDGEMGAAGLWFSFEMEGRLWIDTADQADTASLMRYLGRHPANKFNILVQVGAIKVV